MGEGLDLMNIHDPPGLSGEPAALSPEDEFPTLPPPQVEKPGWGKQPHAIESQL